MADKTRNFHTPVASDVQAITLIVKGGAVSDLLAKADVRSDEPNARYSCKPRSLASKPADYSAAIQTALRNLVVAVAADIATKEGF